jgi:hypothetical protein
MAASASQLQHDNYPSFNLFSIWLLGHLKKHFGQSGGWHWQIRNRNLKNDEKAFKEFFMYLNLFKKSKLKRRQIKVDEESLKYYRTRVKQFRIVDGKQIRVRTTPVKIISTSFSNSTTIILDYVDNKGKEVGGGWEINEAKAIDSLTRSFGEMRGNGKSCGNCTTGNNAYKSCRQSLMIIIIWSAGTLYMRTLGARRLDNFNGYDNDKKL